MMVSTRSLCLSFLVLLVCFLTLPRLADEEPINSRSSGSRGKTVNICQSSDSCGALNELNFMLIDPSYNEDSHVVLTNPLQVRRSDVFNDVCLVFIIYYKS